MKLAVKKLGNPNNPPIIFLHGFMGRGEDFIDLAQDLSSKYFCLLVDLPGHGNSKIPEKNDFESLGPLILDSIGEFSQKFNIIGYSMGGRVALYLILTYPHLFNKAIIESSSPGIISVKERKLRYLNDLKIFTNINSNEEFSSFLEKWYQNPLFGNTSKFKDHLITNKLKNDPEKLKESLSLLSVGNQPSLWEKVKSLEVPTLYLSGEEDKKYTQIGKDISNLSPMINHVVSKNCAHITHLENPGEYKSQTSSFLSN